MTGRVIIVTGTSTGVGKTVATAALAATGRGSIAVVKPVQTGVADGMPSDADEVRRLSGVDVHELATLAEPLAPDTAARRANVTIPPVSEHADRIRELAASHDVVLVEGSGGLLVRLDTDGGTLLDLAVDLARDLPVDLVVVAAAGLGTLNHTELTVGAVRARGLEPSGLVIGSWPDDPDLAERCNLEDLPRVTGLPMLAVLPEGAGTLSREEFVAQADGWFRNRS